MRDQLGFNTDFEKLIGDNLTNLARFWITIRRKIELYLEALCIAGFREKLLGLLGFVRIALNFGVIPNDVRSHRPVHHVTVAFVDVFNDGLRVDGVINRLAHELIVERLVGDVHRQKIHP